MGVVNTTPFLLITWRRGRRVDGSGEYHSLSSDYMAPRTARGVRPRTGALLCSTAVPLRPTKNPGSSRELPSGLPFLVRAGREAANRGVGGRGAKHNSTVSTPHPYPAFRHPRSSQQRCASTRLLSLNLGESPLSGQRGRPLPRGVGGRAAKHNSTVSSAHPCPAFRHPRSSQQRCASTRLLSP